MSIYMPAAYVLINCEYGFEEEIIKELKQLPELVEVYQAYGSYDLIAKVNADTIDKLKEVITWRIRRTDKIKSTLTLIAIEGQS
jgi:DNA-binding Lrp family transcriptional regulator